MHTRRTFLMHTAAAAAAAAAAGAAMAVDIRAARATQAQAPADRKSASALKMYKIPKTDLIVSRLGYGAASLAGWDKNPVNADDIAKAARLVHTASEQGITLFDHADLYGHGKCEAVFGEVLKQSPGLREKIVIQSKCGQRFAENWKPGDPIRADLSREHIVSAVEGSLKRLGTDRLDILLLHAVDALAQPQEIAQALDDLHRSGKVRYFGVSNYHAPQIALLQKSVRQPLVINQMPLSLARPDLIADAMEFAVELAKGGQSKNSPGSLSGHGTLDYCRLNDIQVQAYSPLRGVLNAPADASAELKRTVQLLTELAKKKQTTPAVVALAWLLRHPAGIVPILGGDQPNYIVENSAADRLLLSREEWYDLFAAAT